MATTTPNFGWSVPTSSDLVKNGAVAIETLGDSIDASLVDLKGGTTGQVLAKATNTDMDFTWTTPSGGTNQFYAGKNKIINGAFNVNQRNLTTLSATGYGFDRFALNGSGGTITQSAQTFTAGTAPVSGYEATQFLRAVSSGQSAAGDYLSIYQAIEDVRTFAGQTVTASFWAKTTSGTPQIGIEMFQSFGSGGTPSAAVILTTQNKTLSTSWTRYTATFSVPSIAGKTIGTTNSGYLALNIWVSAGSSYSSRTNIGIQNATFDFWGVQVEAGSTATDFQTATGTLQGELALCQRYYYLHASGGSALIGSGSYNTATNANSAVIFPVQMRVAPTLVATTGTNYYQVTGGGVDDGCNSLTLFIPTVQATQLYNNTEVSGTIGYGVIMRTSNAAASVAFNAEL